LQAIRKFLHLGLDSIDPRESFVTKGQLSFAASYKFEVLTGLPNHYVDHLESEHSKSSFISSYLSSLAIGSYF
jgi:hypothetical protein